MLTDDIYVCHTTSNVLNAQQLCDKVNSILGCTVTNLKDAFLVLCAYSVYISYEEFYRIFPVHSSSPLGKAVPSLIKDGYIAEHNFDAMEGTSRRYYAITKSGYQIANSLCRGNLPVKYRMGRNGMSVAHIYGTGYNLFQFILLGIPFTYEREVLFTPSISYKKRQHALQIDAVCTLRRDGQKRIVCVEQDMGNEKPQILIDKLANYEYFGLMSEISAKTDCIVFSFRRKGIYAEKRPGGRPSPYSWKKSVALLRHMEHYSCDDAYLLLGDSDVDRDYLLSFLLNIGAAKEDDGSIVRGRTRASLDFVRAYSGSLLLLQNPYEHRTFNLAHAALAADRLFVIAQTFLSHAGNLPDSAFPMLKGFPVLFIPTTLLADRIRYAHLSLHQELCDNIRASLTGYYKDIKFEGELSPQIPLTNGMSLKMRNCFSYDCDGERSLIFVEFPSMDLGAWLRAYMFHRLYNGKIPCQLILVFETKRQATSFFEMFSYYYPQICVVYDKKGLLGLMYSNIGKERPLFSVPDATDFSKRYKMLSSESSKNLW